MGNTIGKVYRYIQAAYDGFMVGKLEGFFTRIVSSTLKCNCDSKRLQKEGRDVKMAFSDDKKYENDMQSHLARRV